MQIQSHPARFVAPLMLASLFAFSLFWGLHALISRGHGAMGARETLPTIDFVRLKRATELEIKQRQKPEKPPPPKEPPPPQLSMQAQTKQVTMAPMALNLPTLDLPTNITGGPFLGGFAADVPVQGDAALIPLVRIAPQYPRQALRDGVSGTVKLAIVVGPDGTVKSARVVEAKPRGYFEAAAVSAAYKGRFRPKVVDGTPVETTGEYTVQFNVGE